MGINPANQKLLTEHVFPHLPPDWSVCDLGNQYVHQGLPNTKRPAEDWYRNEGAKHYESIDLNGEGTIQHDLNTPMVPGQHFDLVTDFGTSEHVFNFGECWRTIHKLVVVGGFIAFEKNLEGFRSHGFYNVQLTTWLSLADANNYHVEHLSPVTLDRGIVVRGVFQRLLSDDFVFPTQHRYKAMIG